MWQWYVVTCDAILDLGRHIHMYTHTGRIGAYRLSISVVKLCDVRMGLTRISLLLVVKFVLSMFTVIYRSHIETTITNYQ